MAYNKRKHLQNNIEALRVAFASNRDSKMPENDQERKSKFVMQEFSGFGGLKCVLNPAEKDSDIEQ